MGAAGVYPNGVDILQACYCVWSDDWLEWLTGIRRLEKGFVLHANHQPTGSQSA